MDSIPKTEIVTVILSPLIVYVPFVLMRPPAAVSVMLSLPLKVHDCDSQPSKTSSLDLYVPFFGLSKLVPPQAEKIVTDNIINKIKQKNLLIVNYPIV